MSRDETVVVACLERAEGNESIGTAWIETALFNPDMPIKEILAWAQRTARVNNGIIQGKLMISYADDQRPGGSNA